MLMVRLRAWEHPLPQSGEGCPASLTCTDLFWRNATLGKVRSTAWIALVASSFGWRQPDETHGMIALS
jgi:hypothetical protein